MLALRLAGRSGRLRCLGQPSSSAVALLRPAALRQMPSPARSIGSASTSTKARREAEAELGELVYECVSPSPGRIRVITLLSWAYAGLGIGLATYGGLGLAAAFAAEGSGALVWTSVTLLGLAVASVPLLLRRLLHRFVQLLYFHPASKTFTAVTPTIAFRRSSLSFQDRVEDGVVEAEDLMDPGNSAFLTTALAFGRHPLLFSTQPDDFRSAEAYDELVGTARTLDQRFPELSHAQVRSEQAAKQRGHSDSPQPPKDAQ